MQIKKNYDLTSLNTFGVTSHSKFFIELNNKFELQELFLTSEFTNSNKMFLGEGSNVLFSRDFDGIVIQNKIKGIEILKDDGDFVFIKAMSGERWHDLVVFAVSHGYWGIENLAFIPGTVGGAPIQNIGAYGAELKDVLDSLEIVKIENGEINILKNKECEFGYRDSVFKNKERDRNFILSITIKLNKKPKPNISYKILKEYLENNKIEIDGPMKISDAVTNIRKSKLPNPKEIGNAGSFFKNIFINEEKLKDFKKLYPDVPTFVEQGIVKIPAGWLIEKSGWKGHRVGNVGVHDKQALVLVNYGGASGEEINNLAQDIMDSVFAKFGIKLVPEVNII